MLHSIKDKMMRLHTTLKKKLKSTGRNLAASRFHDKHRYRYASAAFLAAWVFFYGPTFCNTEVKSFFLHPVDNINIFGGVLFLSAMISWILHDLRNEREELQHMLATTYPAAYEFGPPDRLYKWLFVDTIGRMEIGDRDTPVDLAERVMSAKFAMKTKYISSYRKLEGNKCISSFLFFSNLLIIGYVTYCASRIALMMN